MRLVEQGLGDLYVARTFSARRCAEMRGPTSRVSQQIGSAAVRSSRLGEGVELKLVLSRKGVDAGSGGCTSPIVDGTPHSLPIPTKREGVETTYAALGLTEYIRHAKKLSPQMTCHEDPMFGQQVCAFGQTGAAQSHLAKQGVGVGDVFLFFGLFSGAKSQDRHHRIFAYLKVEQVIRLGAEPRRDQSPAGLPRPHPHVLGRWNNNNSLYVGEGKRARRADCRLRLTAPGENVSVWRVPPWLRKAGLTYHRAPERWLGEDRLRAVARGQEFVAAIFEVADRGRR